jgi:very-short-patch-repair endonuclease
LAIEVDGSYHEHHGDEDRARDKFLNSQRIPVLRFSNEEVASSLDSVVARIGQAVEEKVVDPAPGVKR